MKNRKRRHPQPFTSADEDGPVEMSGQQDTNLRRQGVMAILALAAIAMALRTWHIVATQHVPTVQYLLGDAAGYFQWAERIAAGNWYGDETFYQAPLYPYFLASLIGWFDFGVTGVRITQALLGSTAVIAMGLATWHWFGRKAGIVASGMLAMYSPSIYYDGIIQKTSLAAFLTCFLLLTSVWFLRGRTWIAACVCGICLGLLVLTRENALLWVPIFPAWIYLSGKESRRHACVTALAFLAGLAVILVPVAARNASLGGEWSPTTFQAGPNFYIGNNLRADGIYRPLVPGHETPLYERADAVRIAEQTSGHPMSAREVSRFWFEKSLDEINQSPLRWLQLMLQKAFMFINHYEVPDVESMEIYQETSAPLIATQIWNFGMLFPLACCGLYLRNRSSREPLILLILAATMVIAVVSFFILGRYRLPFALLLIPLAASGIVAIVRLVRERRLREMAISTLIFTCCAVPAYLPVHDQTGLYASSLMNAGIAAANHNNMELSLRLLRQARTVAPEIGEVHFNLGMAWLKVGDRSRAIACFRQALWVDPSLTQAQYQLDRLSNPGNPRLD